MLFSSTSQSTFSGNWIKSDTGAYGGALNNYGTIGDVYADFNDNYALGYNTAYGGAIYNDTGKTIGNIVGNFDGNYVISETASVGGGAIYNKGSITGIGSSTSQSLFSNNRI